LELTAIIEKKTEEINSFAKVTKQSKAHSTSQQLQITDLSRRNQVLSEKLQVWSSSVFSMLRFVCV
jgi:hypothetical protein